MAARIGDAQIKVGGFAEVAVAAHVPDNAEILAAIGGIDRGGIAAEKLPGSLKKPVFRSREKTADGNAGIIDAVFAADEIIGSERAIDVRQGMIMDGVYLAEIRAHLADFHQQARGE